MRGEVGGEVGGEAGGGKVALGARDDDDQMRRHLSRT